MLETFQKINGEKDKYLGEQVESVFDEALKAAPYFRHLIGWRAGVGQTMKPRVGVHDRVPLKLRNPVQG